MPSSTSHIELRSEAVQEILTKVPHWMIRWGNVLFLSLIIMLLGISWLVKYPDIIAAEALITTEIPPQKEFAKTTGQLDTILVKDNQLVQPNQPLAIIENAATFKDVILLKSAIDTIQVNNKHFYFPLDNLPILFLGDIETNFSLFENNYLQYVLNKKLQPFSNEALANRLSMLEMSRRLQSLKSQKELNQAELLFKEKDLERSKLLFEMGAISAQEYESKQLEYLQAKRNLENFAISISQMREALNNSQKTSKGTEINRTKEEMILLKSVIQSFNQLKKSIKDWENAYVLKSEIKGQVAFLNFWSKNQNVQQGDLVFSIVPVENSSYIARLKSPAQNSGKVKVGQAVNIKIENYPDTEFGMLKGTLTKVSLFPDKDGLYLIDVSLPEKLRTSYNKDITFKQEMRGTAEIITEDLRLIERFFYQFKNVFK